jgi:hypothetical protein
MSELRHPKEQKLILLNFIGPDGPEDADFATTLDADPLCFHRHPEETVAMFEERVCDELRAKGFWNGRMNGSLAARTGHKSNFLNSFVFRPIRHDIPRSRQYPKILWIDDAEVIGDGITKASPVLGDFVAQEIERGVRELSACGVAFVVRFIPVHETP